MECVKSNPGIEDVKLIMGLLSSSERYFKEGIELLEERFGAIDLASDIIPFDYTTYYNREMGENIRRQFLSFDELIYPGRLVEIKVETNRMEQAEAVDGRRMINIDPGYLTLASLISATKKNASFRVYLGSGIFAQPTLYYQHNTFQPYEWTYKDYRDECHIKFFNQVRDKYLRQSRTAGGEKKL